MRQFLLILMLLLCSVAFGQKYSFITFGTEDGLPQTQVTSVAQDKDGYLWIGTIGGLSRFNGGEFLSFTSKEGLLNNRIQCLNYIESTLWVGHDGGISSIKDNKIEHFALTGDDKSRPIIAILKFNGQLLALSNGGGIFKLVNGKLVSINLQADPTSEVDQEDRKRVRAGYVKDGELYLGTRAGVLKTKDLKSFDLQEEFGAHSVSGVTGNENELIITTYDSLLIRQDLNTNKITTTNPDYISYVRGCYYDSEGSLWLYGKEGLLRISRTGEEIFLEERSGLPLNAVNCVYQDANKNIWIGSQGRGIFRFTGLKFKYYDQSTGYLSDLFMTGFQKQNGDFYLGSFDKSIIHKPKGKPARFIDIDNPNLNIWASIKNINGKDWFCTNFSLISVDNGKVQIFDISNTKGLPGQKMVAFCKIDKNSMYIGGNEGVSIYKNGKFTKLGSRDGEFMGVVRDIEVVDGVLYCVSNHGLFVFKNNNFHPVDLIKQVAYNLEVDNSGTIWVGSEEGFYNIKDGKVNQVSLLNGDPRANCINFLDYRDGLLYVGTNNGLFLVSNLSGKLKIKRYGVSDGIPDLETNLNSSFFDNDGNFWFGTSSGLVCFLQNVGKAKNSVPKINLKSILLNYQAFDYNKYSEKLDEDGMPVWLNLPFNKNNLIFELDGVSLINHANLKYQFLLEGLNDDWSPLSSVSTITFTNLPAGDYVLKVRVVDIDGETSEVKEMHFTIQQAYYKTWWFITLCILFLAIIVLLIFRMRVKRIRQINENEMLGYKARLMALEQKSLNASMNRHFIFNSLNSIQYFINTRDRLSANKYLTNFAQLIRKNLDSASWEDNRITLEEEVSRIELYLSLESMRFKDRFEYHIETNGIEMDSYKIPAMIMQPFIENSIIHGVLPKEEVKGKIEVTMKIEKDILEILIVDNGIGVNQSLSRKSNDVGDHRSQGMEITSKRIELMHKFSDQTMELIGPKEIIGNDGSINGTYVLLKIKVENLDD